MTANDSSQYVIDQIRRSPELLNECKANISIIQKALEPASLKLLNQVMTDLVVIYGNRWDDNDVVTRAKQLYFEALSDLPAEALIYAKREYIKSDAEYYPKPGQLRSLALAYISKLKMAEYRARQAISLCK